VYNYHLPFITKHVTIKTLWQNQQKEKNNTLKERKADYVPAAAEKRKKQANFHFVKVAVSFSGTITGKYLILRTKQKDPVMRNVKRIIAVPGAENLLGKNTAKLYVLPAWTNSTSIIPGRKDRQKKANNKPGIKLFTVKSF